MGEGEGAGVGMKLGSGLHARGRGRRTMSHAASSMGLPMSMVSSLARVSLVSRTWGGREGGVVG